MKRLVSLIVIMVLVLGIVKGFAVWNQYQETLVELKELEYQLRREKETVQESIEFIKEMGYDVAFSDGVYTYYFKDGYIIAKEYKELGEGIMMGWSAVDMTISNISWDSSKSEVIIKPFEEIMLIDGEIYPLKSSLKMFRERWIRLSGLQNIENGEIRKIRKLK